MIDELSNPDVRVIDMASAEQAEPGGRMFWDKRTDRWTFFAHNMPAGQAGREYQLWLITPGGRTGRGGFWIAVIGLWVLAVLLAGIPVAGPWLVLALAWRLTAPSQGSSAGR